MPFQYEVLKDGNLVYTQVSGVLSHEESLARHRQVASDATIKPGFAEIVDFRRVTQVEVDERTILAIAEIDQQAGAKMVGGKVAVVAGEAFVYRLQHAFPKGFPRRVIVFSELETAARWLGIENLDEVLGEG